MSIDTGPRNPPSAVSAGPPLPLSAEIARQLRRRRTIGIFIVLTVLPLVLLLASWLGNDGNDSGERGFVDLAQESGATLVIFTLFASTSFLLPARCSSTGCFTVRWRSPFYPSSFQSRKTRWTNRHIRNARRSP